MSRFAAILLSLSFLAVPASLATLVACPVAAHAIEIWHTDSFFGGQGMCVHTFRLDAQDIMMQSNSGVEGLSLEIAFLDAAGNTISRDQAEIQDVFGTSPPTRYREVPLYDTCEDVAAFALEKATGIIGGKRVNLLHTGQITMREFVSLPILVPGDAPRVSHRSKAPLHGETLADILTITPVAQGISVITIAEHILPGGTPLFADSSIPIFFDGTPGVDRLLANALQTKKPVLLEINEIPNALGLEALGYRSKTVYWLQSATKNYE